MRYSISIAATCTKAKKVIQEKYIKELDTKATKFHQKCKEKVLKLEEDISGKKKRLKDITDAIADCKTQIKVTLDELNHCKTILLRNKECFENER